MEIFLYTLSIMYSPGPVNFMGLNSGLQRQVRQTLGFFAGVGAAMLVLFVLFGYAGEHLIAPQYLHYMALVGALYTFYIASKMLRASVDAQVATVPQRLGFWNGFFIQALNPKGVLVILPVTTVMYPAAHIVGSRILVVSLLISVGAAGAPLAYALAGRALGNHIANALWLKRMNKLLALLLLLSGVYMLWDFVQGVHLL